jgi:S-adenosyl methyltransferase
MSGQAGNEGQNEGREYPGRETAPNLDTRHAHSARVYNYWLGGQDNYAADREAAEQAIAANPGIVADVQVTAWAGVARKP